MTDVPDNKNLNKKTCSGSSRRFRAINEVLAVIFSVGIIGTIVGIYHQNPEHLKTFETPKLSSALLNNISDTDIGINEHAALVIQRMDLSVNPCDSFYHFACGNFVKTTDLPAKRHSINTFTLLRDKIRGQLHSLITEKINENDPKPFNMVKKLFNACMRDGKSKASIRIEIWYFTKLLKWNGIFGWITEQGFENQASKCVTVCSASFSAAVGAMYVQKYFDQRSKEEVLDIFKHIKKEFHLILSDVEWMDTETKQSALNKLEAMDYLIGHPDVLMNNSKIEEFYENVEIDENDYIFSLLNVITFFIDAIIMKDDSDEVNAIMRCLEFAYILPPFHINAFHLLITNGIYIPAGIMQGHFYSANRPQYMNYGALGSIIGHEIAHAFDNNGSQYDLKGNLVDWWQPESKAIYLQKMRCISEQYNNYTDILTRLNVDGNKTLGENASDITGMKLAYLAYKRYQSENPPEPSMPGLNYTSQQMFWISAAQNWCDISRADAYRRHIIEIDVHSPARIRVLGSLKNQKEFANDFQCPEGSTMNPVKKCEIW